MHYQHRDSARRPGHRMLNVLRCKQQLHGSLHAKLIVHLSDSLDIKMTAVFELPISSETLEPEEIQRITGAARPREQIEWLDKNGWVYQLNRARLPIVGRLYARLRMLGVPHPASVVNQSGWAPDFSAIN